MECTKKDVNLNNMMFWGNMFSNHFQQPHPNWHRALKPAAKAKSSPAPPASKAGGAPPAKAAGKAKAKAKAASVPDSQDGETKRRRDASEAPKRTKRVKKD